MKIDKSEAEKVLEFIAFNSERLDVCGLYIKALKANKKTPSEAKNQWTNRDVIDEILLAYEKTLAPKPQSIATTLGKEP